MPSLTSLSRQFDAALHQFKALDLGMSDEERYPSCGIGCYDPKKKTYPSIYLSGPKDDFMDLPDSGEAVIQYKVTRRATEETDGKKRHNLTIEVRSIDPKASMKATEKKKAEGRAVAIATMSNGEGGMTNFARGDQMMKALKKFTPQKKHQGKETWEKIRSQIPARGHPEIASAAKGLKFLRKEGVMKRPKMGRKESEGMADRLISTSMRWRPESKFSEFNRPRDGDGQFVANVTGGADPVTMRQAYGPDPKKSKLLAPGAAAAALGTAGLLGTKAGRVMAVTGAKRAARVVRSTVTGIDRAFPGKTSQGQARTPKRGRAEYPVMGRKVVRDPGFGETLLRQRMRGD